MPSTLSSSARTSRTSTTSSCTPSTYLLRYQNVDLLFLFLYFFLFPTDILSFRTYFYLLSMLCSLISWMICFLSFVLFLLIYVFISWYNYKTVIFIFSVIVSAWTSSRATTPPLTSSSAWPWNSARPTWLYLTHLWLILIHLLDIDFFWIIQKKLQHGFQKQNGKIKVTWQALNNINQFEIHFQFTKDKSKNLK